MHTLIMLRLNRWRKMFWFPKTDSLEDTLVLVPMTASVKPVLKRCSCPPKKEFLEDSTLNRPMHVFESSVEPVQYEFQTWFLLLCHIRTMTKHRCIRCLPDEPVLHHRLNRCNWWFLFATELTWNWFLLRVFLLPSDCFGFFELSWTELEQVCKILRPIQLGQATKLKNPS